MHADRPDNLPSRPHHDLVEDLIRYFLQEGFVVHGAVDVPPYAPPSPVRNDGSGTALPKKPDVVGFDPMRKRIVFGLVKEDRIRMESEDSLEEYNVFLDHNHNLGDQASVLYVLLPQTLMQDFSALITHYIHREYWHRIVPVGMPDPTGGSG
jgi:hypothetical protein